MNSEISENQSEMAAAMTVAGSDSGGGAGIQADLLTFAALGVYGTTAITCLTAQSPTGVRSIEVMPPSFVKDQMEQVMEFFPIGAIKTGMLFNARIVETVAEFIQSHPGIKVIVDPVMVATSGALLLKDDAIACFTEVLLPRATIITPNLDEVAVLCGWKPQCEADMIRAAGELSDKFKTSVLVKGGHLEGDTVVDIFLGADGLSRIFKNDRIKGVNTHGSGCTLSSAVAAFLARKFTLKKAVESSITYVRNSLKNPALVSGERFISHLVSEQPTDPEIK